MSLKVIFFCNCTPSKESLICRFHAEHDDPASSSLSVVSNATFSRGDVVVDLLGEFIELAMHTKVVGMFIRGCRNTLTFKYCEDTKRTFNHCLSSWSILRNMLNDSFVSYLTEPCTVAGTFQYKDPEGSI